MKISIRALTLSAVLFCASSALAETVKISIPDMECDDCAHAIQDRLKLEKGVQKIDLDIKNRAVTVTIADQSITDEKLKTLIQDAGFTPEKLEHL